MCSSSSLLGPLSNARKLTECLCICAGLFAYKFFSFQFNPFHAFQQFFELRIATFFNINSFMQNFLRFCG